jgi:hypothetical protein
MKTIEEYALGLAADVAMKGIRILLKDTKDMSLGDKDMYSISFNVEGDGRICNKVYTLLKDKGIVESFNYTQGSRYSHYNTRKERKHWYGTISQEWFSKNSPALGITPVFKTSGVRKERENSYSTSETNKLVTDLDNYRSIRGYPGFTNAEQIYLYWNLKDYDIQKITVKDLSRSPRYGSSEHEEIRIYPKALLTDLSKGVYHDHAIDYLDKHVEWVIKNVLNIPDDKILNRVKFSHLHDPTFIMKDMKDWDSEFVSKQLKRIEQLKTILNLGGIEYIELQEAVDKTGGWDRVKVIAQEKFFKYLEENFPLHIGENEKDEDLKKLCEWVMQGKNNGFSELQQRVSKTTTEA